MSFLLDTDHCIAWLRGNKAVLQKVDEVGWTRIAISPITAGELFHGAYLSNRPKAGILEVKRFLHKCRQRPFLSNAMMMYGKIKADLQRQGFGIESRDLLIACTAIADGRILVTNNSAHFQNIPEIQLDNWYER